MRNAYAIILAGGYGTRFWPASRRARPKQFLPLTGKESLLQQTYRRVARLFPPSRIYVVGNAEHARLLRQQLPRLPRRNLLLEPVGRNTTAAIALAVAHLRAARRRGEEDALLAVFPADHAIRNPAKFRRVVRGALAAAAVAEDAMVVLGIPPTAPHTGYGYIERGRSLRRVSGQSAYAARRFTEKPDARTAARYLRTGRFYWNSGMFFWRLSVFTALLRRHLPRTYGAAEELLRSIGRRGYAARVERAYRKLPNISVDYALAEPAAAAGKVRVIPAEMGWSDLGSWSALADWLGPTAGAAHFSLDARGNFVHAPGPPKADALPRRASLGLAPRAHKFTAALGAENLIVVETPDALLLCRRDRAQDVGKVVDYLRRKRLHRWL